MFKHLACAVLSVGLLACGTESSPEGGPVLPEQYADEVSQVRIVSDMLARSEDGRVVVDLRTTEGFFIERSVDTSAVDVICPSNRRMNLKQWLPELAAEFEVAPAELERDLFLYSPSSRDDIDVGIPVCASNCYLHREPDGTWACLC